MVRARRPHRAPVGARGRVGRERGWSLTMTMLTAILLLLGTLTPTTGTVRDERTGAPLSGAVVHVIGDARAPVITDSAGRFVIDIDAPVRIRIARIGYADTE